MASSAPSNMEVDPSLALLEKAQAMIELEQALTATMEKVEPWLPSQSSKLTPNRPRVRPLPATMEAVDAILAVARNWAARTSAPAGWNPTGAVMGFTTPSPMPHQLRGGALAAQQLERARQADRDKKRQRVEQQQQETEEEQAAAAESDAAGNTAPMDTSKHLSDPKHREVEDMEKELQRSKSDLAHDDAARQERSRRIQQQQQQSLDVSMNLSDSSSDEEDD